MTLEVCADCQAVLRRWEEFPGSNPGTTIKRCQYCSNYYKWLVWQSILQRIAQPTTGGDEQSGTTREEKDNTKVEPPTRPSAIKVR